MIARIHIRGCCATRGDEEKENKHRKRTRTSSAECCCTNFSFRKKSFKLFNHNGLKVMKAFILLVL